MKSFANAIEMISIHALREEGDAEKWCFRPQGEDFNPRPPRGGRRPCSPACSRTRKFQSTPSARRATRFHAASGKDFFISIHALREEGDFA